MKNLIESLPFLFDNILYDKSNEINGTFNPTFICITQSRWDKESKDISTYHGQATTSVHEKIHWLQYVGTSWGQMTLLIKFVQSQVLTDAYKKEGFDKVQEMFDKMNIEPNYFVDLGKLELTDLNYYGLLDTLVSHQLSFHLCSHGNVDYDSVHNLDEKFSKCIADSHFYSNIYFESDKLEYKNIKESYKNKFKDFKEHYSLGGHFTTLDLLEGQARASEFIHFLHRSAFSKSYYEKTFDKYFIDQSYWKAFGSFMFAIGEEVDWFNPERLLINLSKFCIVVDIALNPKTFLNSNFYEFLSQDIEDFFPSRRFINCSIAAKDYKGEFNYKQEEHHKKFENFICDFNNYTNPTELARNFVKKYQTKNLKFQEEWESENFKIRRIPLINYYFYVFSKYCNVRETHPIHIQNLGITVWFPKKSMQLRFRDDYKFFNCPFYCYDESRKIYNLEIEPEKFFWLLGEVMKPEVMKCALLKQYNMENYFPFIIPTNMVEALEELCIEEFGIKMKIQKSTTPNNA